MSQQHKPFKEQQYYLLVSQLAAAKKQAQNLTLHCIHMPADKVTKARASNIISLLHDAEDQLDKIAEELKWKQL